jgi:hypothetical protein
MPFTLVSYAVNLGINIEYWDFVTPLEAIYRYFPGIPPTIGLSRTLFSDPIHYRCVLAEELGHYHTTKGNMLTENCFHYKDRLYLCKQEFIEF